MEQKILDEVRRGRDDIRTSAMISQSLITELGDHHSYYLLV